MIYRFFKDLMGWIVLAVAFGLSILIAMSLIALPVLAALWFLEGIFG